MPLPTFMIIGAAKAGTTSLHQYLQQHPQIFMSKPKEPRFFALEGQPINFRGPGDMDKFAFVTDWDQYKALFNNVASESAIGEASTWYLYVPQSPYKIRQRIPNVKLIAILRDPVQRAFSNYLHARREGVEPLDDFCAAMEAEQERVSANWSYRFHYKSKGYYFEQISRYLNVFPNAQIKILLFEDMKNDAKRLLTEVCNYLGVDESFSWDTFEKFNVAGTPRNQMADLALRSARRLGRRLNFAGPAGRELRRVKYLATKLNTEPPPELAPATRGRFVGDYEEDILRLQDLIDRDLSAWLTVD